MRSPRLIIVGSGGHAGVVIGAVPIGDLFGLIDEFEKIGTRKHGYTVIDYPKDYERYKFHVAIGDNATRAKMCNRPEVKDRLCGIMHPFARICQASIGLGSYIAAGGVVGYASIIGIGVIINTNASVDHDCVVGDFVHIAPGSTVCGRATIGELTMIGTGSCVRDGITIGKNCMIGMGSVVTKNIPDNAVAWGNPCHVRSIKTTMSDWRVVDKDGNKCT